MVLVIDTQTKCKILLIALLIPLAWLLSSSLKTNDYCATPQLLKDQLRERYPEARRAFLKSGGDFPFLSRPDEVNLHLQVDKIYLD